MRPKYLARDFRQRLDNGVVFYRGQPYYMSIGDSSVGSLRKLTDIGRNVLSVNVLEDVDLDISSPKLGFINTDRHCYYLTRTPSRAYKQSLCTSALEVHDPCTGSHASNFNRDAAIYSQYGIDMFLGNYPTLDQAKKMLDVERRKAVAFDRNAALSIDKLGIIRVHYRTDEVGYIPPGSDIVRIPSHDFSWVVSAYLSGYGWEID